MEQDFVIVTSANRVINKVNSFTVTLGSNVFAVGDKLHFSGTNPANAIIGRVIAHPTGNQYVILKED